MIHIAATWRTGVVQAHTATGEPEWPTHPERLVEALLAGAWRRDDGAAHRAALRSLEGVAPVVRVTPYAASGFVMDRYARNVKTDKPLVSEVLFRTNPTVVVGDGPHVIYSYELDENPERDAVIADLLGDVWYLGESASSVTLRMIAEPPQGMRLLVPQKGRGNRTMRVPQIGRLDVLEESYARRIAGVAAATRTSGTFLGKNVADEPGKAENRDYNNAVKAHLIMREFREAEAKVSLQRYSEVGEVADSPFDLVASVFAARQADVTGENFAAIIAAFRQAWLDRLDTNDPRLTGHELDGKPTKLEHVGFVPLLDVGREYATGTLHGFGVLIPRSFPDDLRTVAENAVTTVVNVHGQPMRMPVEYEASYRAREGSRAPRLRIADRIRESSKSWATITPAMPWRHVKPRHLRQDPRAMEPALFEMFERAGLPRPKTIEWGPASVVAGAPHVGSIARDALMRELPPLQHLRFTFEEEVSGPIVLGRRAWKGFGLCLPTK